MTDLCQALLRAIAEKLIPGIPEGTRVAILQQSRLVDANDDTNPAEKEEEEKSVLQEVVDRAIAVDTVEQEIKCKFLWSLSTDNLQEVFLKWPSLIRWH